MLYHKMPQSVRLEKLCTYLLFFVGKGQFISKCPFGVFVWTKIPTKFFPGFMS